MVPMRHMRCTDAISQWVRTACGDTLRWVAVLAVTGTAAPRESHKGSMPPGIA